MQKRESEVRERRMGGSRVWIFEEVRKSIDDWADSRMMGSCILRLLLFWILQICLPKYYSVIYSGACQILKKTQTFSFVEG